MKHAKMVKNGQIRQPTTILLCITTTDKYIAQINTDLKVQ